MERRKFLIGAGSAAVGTSAIIGSGAFDSVSANRDFDVKMVADEDAYLSLNAVDEDYAREENGSIELFFDEESSDDGGEGINGRADTRFNDVISIKNQGTEEIDVWVATDDPTEPAFLSIEWIAGSHSTPSGEVDISYPIGKNKTGTNSNDPQDPKRGDYTDGGYVTLGTGESVPIDIRFLIKNDVGGRGEQGAVFQIRADTDGPPTENDYTEEDLNA